MRLSDLIKCAELYLTANLKGCFIVHLQSNLFIDILKNFSDGLSFTCEDIIFKLEIILIIITFL